jgi:2-polyprenyl-3-methyl-5-hydroxy-6-metoxy-1,4-benzoquinol methylase
VDRVAQTYNRQALSGLDQDILIERIDWVVDQADQGPVLDIGCSQGVATYLLAVKGLDVTGMDINEEALAFARQNYETKKDLKGALRFISGDLLNCKAEPIYDTVVLTEVIEHFSNPNEIFENVQAHLKPGGKLIVTTPYGYHPEDDHDIFFTMHNFAEAVPDNLSIDKYYTKDGYIRAILYKRYNEGSILSAIQLQELEVEAGFDKAKTLYRFIEEFYKRLTASHARNKELHQKLGECAKKYQQVTRNPQSLAAEFASLSSTLELLNSTLEEQTQNTASILTKYNGLIERNKSLEVMLETKHKQQLEEYSRIYQKVRRNPQSLTHEIASLSSALEEQTQNAASIFIKYNGLIARGKRREAMLAAKQKQLDEFHQSISFRAGKYLTDAAKRPWPLLAKLPFNLGRLLWQAKRQGAQMPLAIGARRWGIEDFIKPLDDFAAHIRREKVKRVLFIFSGTTFIQDLRANRPIRFAKVALENDTGVLFNFHRWRDTDEVPPYEQPSLLQIPIDITLKLLDTIATLDLGDAEKIFMPSYPHPGLARRLNRFALNGWTVTYDVRDDWEAFHEVGAAKWYDEAFEKYLVHNVQFVTTVSKVLAEKMRGYDAQQKVVVVPNGYDESFRRSNYRHKPNLKNGPIVGYFGHLTPQWFDFDSLFKVARMRPGYLFELIGHSAPDNLDLPDNVKLLGPQSHEEINKIAARWSAALICFKIGPLASGVDPIKIYEYLALGLPTVSLTMPQIDDYPYTKTVDTPKTFAIGLDKAVETKIDQDKADQWLIERTWNKRLEQIFKLAKMHKGRFKHIPHISHGAKVKE